MTMPLENNERLPVTVLAAREAKLQWQCLAKRAKRNYGRQAAGQHIN